MSEHFIEILITSVACIYLIILSLCFSLIVWQTFKEQGFQKGCDSIMGCPISFYFSKCCFSKYGRTKTAIPPLTPKAEDQPLLDP
jgi:hypothetical protein